MKHLIFGSTFILGLLTAFAYAWAVNDLRYEYRDLAWAFYTVSAIGLTMSLTSFYILMRR